MPARYTPCPSGRHRAHPTMTCEEVGDRQWDPITGYRTEKEMAANPTQFTGLLGLAAREN